MVLERRGLRALAGNSIDNYAFAIHIQAMPAEAGDEVSEMPARKPRHSQVL
jgi:hypothetical protein